MKILQLLTCMLALCFGQLSAQQVNSPAQIQRLLAEGHDDTTEVRLKRDLALHYKIRDTARAFKLLDEAMELSQAVTFGPGIGMINEAKGEIHYYYGFYEEAIQYFVAAKNSYQEAGEDLLKAGVIVDEGNANLFLARYDIALDRYETALDLFTRYSDIPGMSRCLNNMGIIYKNYGWYDQALESYNKVAELYLQISDSTSLTDTYINTGVVYVLRGHYHHALENFSRALEFAKATGNQDRVAKTLLNIGVIHNKMQNYKQAIEYYKESLEVSMALGDKVEISKALTNIGTNYIPMEEYDLAELFIRRGLDLKEELGDLRSISNCYNYLGEIYFFTGAYNKAVNENIRAIELKRELNDREGLARCFAGISRSYLELGRFSLAAAYADSSLDLSLELGLLEQIVDAYAIQKDIMVEAGNYRQAYELSELHKIFSDSLMGENKARAVQEIEFKYKSEMLAEENERLQIQTEMDGLLINRHRKIIISVSAAIIMFALALIMLYVLNRREKHFSRSLRKKNQIITKQNIQLETLNNTKDKILSVVSHDLRGTIGNQLTALSLLAREDFKDVGERKLVFSRLANSATLSLEILENLAHWINLQEGKIEYIPEEGNVESILHTEIKYFSESLANKELVLIKEIKDSCIGVFDELMIRSVIRNLLSNAIKFSRRGGEIRVITRRSGDHLNVVVKDQGIGMSEGEIRKLKKGEISKFRRGTENEKGSGLGLALVKAFLEYHNSELQLVSDANSGTGVSFSLPCIDTESD